MKNAYLMFFSKCQKWNASMLDTKRIKANEKMTESPNLFYMENDISKMPKLSKTKCLKWLH